MGWYRLRFDPLTVKQKRFALLGILSGLGSGYLCAMIGGMALSLWFVGGLITLILLDKIFAVQVDVYTDTGFGIGGVIGMSIVLHQFMGWVFGYGFFFIFFSPVVRVIVNFLQCKMLKNNVSWKPFVQRRKHRKQRKHT